MTHPDRLPCKQTNLSTNKSILCGLTPCLIKISLLSKMTNHNQSYITPSLLEMQDAMRLSAHLSLTLLNLVERQIFFCFPVSISVGMGICIHIFPKVFHQWLLNSDIYMYILHVYGDCLDRISDVSNCGDHGSIFKVTAECN